jgi:hypothetical protein
MTDELYLAPPSKAHTDHERRQIRVRSGTVLDIRRLVSQQGVTMTSTTPLTSADLAPRSVAYVDCDIPEGQTLVEWRVEHDAACRVPRRTLRVPRLPRLPLLRPAW